MDDQAISPVACEAYIGWKNVVQDYLIQTAFLSNVIVSVAQRPDIGIVFQAAIQKIISLSTFQRVVTLKT